MVTLLNMSQNFVHLGSRSFGGNGKAPFFAKYRRKRNVSALVLSGSGKSGSEQNERNIATSGRSAGDFMTSAKLRVLFSKTKQLGPVGKGQLSYQCFRVRQGSVTQSERSVACALVCAPLH